MNFILIFLLLIISSNENLYAYNQNVFNHVDSVKLALSKNLSDNQLANLKTSASLNNTSKTNQVPVLDAKIDFVTLHLNKVLILRKFRLSTLIIFFFFLYLII